MGRCETWNICKNPAEDSAGFSDFDSVMFKRPDNAGK